MRIADIPVVSASAMPDCTAGELFALQVLGEAMRPEFDPGDIVVVEPDGLAVDGSFVVAYCRGEWMLRHLARREDGWLLETLNPDAADATPAMPIDDLSAVRGVVIQKSRPGRRRFLKRFVE
ncbi:MAG TPA: S24 family peptidase [Burkholderiaceae bacterium]|nr:S24 family peptidase [Burkholderiaceae bacterium]